MTLSRAFSLNLLVVALMFGIFANAHADSFLEIERLMKQGRNAQALEQADKYLAGNPKDAQARFLKGLILTEMNRSDEAIVVFQKLTEDYPELPEPYNNLAVIYAQQKQYEKAKQALEAAIRTHPAYATAHENLGDVYARMASQAYDKALQIDSSNTSAQSKLSMIRNLVGVRVAQAKPATNAEPKVAVAKPPQAEPATPAVAAPPVAKPASPKPAPPKPAPEPRDTIADVTKAVQSWAVAWSKKDVKAYLAHYANDFAIPGGGSRADWEAERTDRIDKPGAINISIGELKVTPESADKATARFRQHYRSATFKSSSVKTLVLVSQDGRWLIQQERIGR
ncbi:MAG: tetratricopeptide repeat protein [Gammaproteobacteria bacterium]|nr:tetratricopeptide repeat protein [Gammaproteobacteria bacterium]MBU1415295.1 tetratricopeptide repeat protein [Gammaproteobacteria bacterium]